MSNAKDSPLIEKMAEEWWSEHRNDIQNSEMIFVAGAKAMQELLVNHFRNLAEQTKMANAIGITEDGRTLVRPGADKLIGEFLVTAKVIEHFSKLEGQSHE